MNENSFTQRGRERENQRKRKRERVRERESLVLTNQLVK